MSSSTQNTGAQNTGTQTMAQRVRDSQPQMFLSLVPTTSASYPTAESIKPATHTRRSSSQSSASSTSTNSLRFLKLGPVHYGEQQEDYHEVAVDEEKSRIATSWLRFTT
ncbi:uncharacterized protein F4812DRAFT_461708 [Daldinia caldariorum]|uniref:uncharacterized protein n=1 Tax=Daldinia caldariorum TaxID=326644 RepID=UPI002008DAC1|nr:uncharacterized protein F4812DRAFT_461708 [Daldinia caldariorum]KAI1465397.1 hypothetical protein F4812DRAFT_461708 [Daldinia caldariorum]